VPTVSDYNELKKLEVDSGTTAPGSGKAQPVVLDGSAAASKTGNGTIGYDKSQIDTTDTSSKLQSICFFDEDETTVKDYEVENPSDLGTDTNVVVWVYDSGYTADGSVQLVFAYGGGDGTDNQNVTGTWDNTGQNAVMVQHLNGNATDSTSNNNDGTINGATSTDEGQLDGAYSGDGTEDNIAFDPAIASASTAVFWGKTPTTGTDKQIIFSHAFDFGNDEGYVIQMPSGQSQEIKTFFGTGDGIADTSYNANEFYSIAVTSDASTGDAEMFVDGSSVNSGTSDYNGNGDNQMALLEERQDSGFNGNNFDGVTDELRYYSDIKSSDWVQANYDASPKAGHVFFSQQAAETTATTNQNTAAADTAIKSLDNEATAAADLLLEDQFGNTASASVVLEAQGQSNTASADLYLSAGQEISATGDVVIEDRDQQQVAGADAALASTDNDRQVAGDLVIENRDASETAAVDAVVESRDNDKSVTADVVLEFEDQPNQADAGAAIKAEDRDATATADMYIQQPPLRDQSKSFNINTTETKDFSGGINE